MSWAKRGDYSLEQLNRAGEMLTRSDTTEDQRDRALVILDNWRAAHSYPLHVFKIRLKKVAKIVDKNAFAVRRLKRTPAIIRKLKRSYNGKKPTMNLSQMQDIGGCRAVLSSINQVNKVYQDYYLKGNLKHKKVGEKNYILHPKSDGYRGIHLIYKYVSDKGKKEYNGLLIEIQIRTKIQHVWATALETVDLFTKQAIKSNEGSKEWMEFFKLVSAAFASIEDSPTVPGAPVDEKELFLEIKRIEKELNVIKKIIGWTEAMQAIQHAQFSPGMSFFLLDLDINNGGLQITGYKRKDEQIALSDYSVKEKKYAERKDHDVVLVEADSATDLRKAYPNYFFDAKEFISNLEKIIHKY